MKKPEGSTHTFYNESEWNKMNKKMKEGHMEFEIKLIEEIYNDSHTTGNGIEVFHTSLKNAGHDYLIKLSEKEEDAEEILFQNGNTIENGINGLTNEVLLAILIHRTKSLNDKFPCEENALAIESMKKALSLFEERIIERKKRDVYGKDVK